MNIHKKLLKRTIEDVWELLLCPEDSRKVFFCLTVLLVSIKLKRVSEHCESWLASWCAEP